MAKRGKKEAKDKQEGLRPLILILVVILILAVISMIFAGIISLFLKDVDFSPTSGQVALISIKGALTTDDTASLLMQGTDSASLVKLIEKAEAPHIDAVIFEIDSPGGSPVASDEIATAIKRLDKPTVSYIREVGASGGYWVASATDHIFANKMSITGSIGVIASYLEFAGFIQRYNITNRRLVGGEFKDIGSAFKMMTPIEENMLQQQIDILHGYFIDEVAENRGMSREKVEEVATGMFYLGQQAKDMGLIDDIGGKEEALAYLEKEMNMSLTIVEIKPKVSFLESFSHVFTDQSFSVGRGIGDALINSRTESRIELVT